MRSFISAVLAAAVMAPVIFCAAPVFCEDAPSGAETIVEDDGYPRRQRGTKAVDEIKEDLKETVDSEPVAPTPIAPPVSVISSATPTPQPFYLKALELKADIAERNYYADPNLQNLGHFIGMQQNIIAAICFGDLRESLEYNGYPEDERCRGLIKKVLAIDGNSPVAICAQFGIDSRQCQEASDAVKPGVYYPDSGSWSTLDRTKSDNLKLLDQSAAVRERTLAKKLNEADKALNTLSSSLRVTPDSAVKKQFETALHAQLKLLCLDEEWAVSPVESNAGTSEPSGTTGLIPDDNAGPRGKKPKDPETDVFAGVLDTLEKSRPTAAPTVAPIKFEGSNFIHYRLNPNGCNRYLQKGLEIIPTSPLVVCYRDGGVSPSCIQARRRHVTAGPGAKKVATPFETF